MLRERWIFVAVALVVGLGAGTALYATTPVFYTATLPLYVSSQTALTPQAAFQGAQLAQQRVGSYSELLSSTRVSSEVVKELGLPFSPQALAGNITATTAPDSVVINLTVSDTNPARAAQIADSAGAVFTKLVAELEQPTDPKVVAPVSIDVVQQAAVPTSPASAGLTRSVLPGVLVGLIVGIAAALLRHRSDNSVKSSEQMRDITHVPNLGTVAYAKRAASRPLTVNADPLSPQSEAYRKLRTNLQYIDVDNPPQVVIVASSVPAEGKSTTVANLAAALASARNRVLVIDADLRKPSLAALLGVDGSVGLTNVLTKRVGAAQAIQESPDGGFDVLASGPLPPNPSELLASGQMTKLLEEVRGSYDVVLVDTPPLLPVTDAAVVARVADGVLLVCRVEKTNRAQLVGAVRALNAVSARLLGTVMTMSTGRSGAAEESEYYGGYYGPADPRAIDHAMAMPPGRDHEVQRIAQRSEGRERPAADPRTTAVPVVPGPQPRPNGNGHANGGHANGGGRTGNHSVESPTSVVQRTTPSPSKR